MIIIENVTKTFGAGNSALEDITLTIAKGEFVFLVGPSGSGKTSLLRLLIRDMIPTRGKVTVNEVDLTKLPESKVPHLRRQIGVVFQDLKMLTERTIFENIVLPLEMAGMDHEIATKKVDVILEQVGISSHRDRFPIQLSGGELQRAAIARALIFSPDILLADEPTGNLDNVTSWEIVKLLQDINKSGTTVIMATHNMDIVNSLAKRTVILEKGKVIKDTAKKISKETEEVDRSDEKQEETTKEPKVENEDIKEEKKTHTKDVEEKEQQSEKEPKEK